MNRTASEALRNLLKTKQRLIRCQVRRTALLTTITTAFVRLFDNYGRPLSDG